MARGDIAELFDHADPQYAAMVVKHEYEPNFDRKFLNREQTKYKRKNWSSCVLWNCAHPANKVLTPQLINSPDTENFNVGLHLHQFAFLKDHYIGALPRKWNHLVDIYSENHDAKLVHWTEFGPWLDGNNDVPYAGEWFKNLFGMLDIKRS
jgi:lipopolysaccharide biosynthesis glycosyltransferase